VLLSGEAGIGKSRILDVLKKRLSNEPHIKIETRCSPYYQTSSFYPIIEHLQRLLDFKKDESPQEKLIKLESFLEPYDFPLGETLPLFATLLSLPIPDHYPPLILIPERRRQKTFEALLTLLQKESENQPVLRIVEDIHWVDPSTLEYLKLMVEQVSNAPLFTLLTFRPDFTPPWAMSSHITQITLNRLTRKQIEMMVQKVTKGNLLPSEVMKQVVAKTDGVPLFVEEYTKMILESGLIKDTNGHFELSGSLQNLSIPATLNDLLIARLDKLEVVKEVVQIGATLGREFNYELIQSVSQFEQEVLRKELEKLMEAEILYQRDPPPNATYTFKHALIQEAAYQSLLKSKRQQYHQKIAQVMEEQFPEIAETQSEILAHHYTEAGYREKAIPFWHKAGSVSPRGKS